MDELVLLGHALVLFAKAAIDECISAILLLVLNQQRLSANLIRPCTSLQRRARLGAVDAISNDIVSLSGDRCALELRRLSARLKCALLDGSTRLIAAHQLWGFATCDGRRRSGLPKAQARRPRVDRPTIHSGNKRQATLPFPPCTLSPRGNESQEKAQGRRGER